jgi:DNA repair protein RecO (recombination protein O)
VKTYKARGIVLHTIKYGEGGLVAYVLTDVGGRRSYLVQGVHSKRGKGNKAAMLQPMFLIEFEGLESTKSDMHRFRDLRSAVGLGALGGVSFDVRKSTVSLFMAELLYRLVREVEANAPLFEFVWGAVCDLNAMTDVVGVANFHLWFMVGLARHLGFAPGNEWSEGSWFDIREGLFVRHEPWHGSCFSRENAALLGVLGELGVATSAGGAVPPVIPTEALGADEGSFLSVALAQLHLNRTQRADFLNSMLVYFGYHLDAVRDIRSVDILREVF